MGDINKIKRSNWLRRKGRVRKKVRGTSERPRLTVFRSNKYIYAQVVDDQAGRTLAAASSLKLTEAEAAEDLGGKCATAFQVGRQLAEVVKGKGIEQIVFDRNGYLYHGRVAALARGVREGGVKF